MDTAERGVAHDPLPDAGLGRTKSLQQKKTDVEDTAKEEDSAASVNGRHEADEKDLEAGRSESETKGQYFPRNQLGFR
nr:hypothetical protein CFP56_08139 [Quercus suber]